ncbi:hypothetical protein UFOVP105_15 [uncultured Caudovirales phage]|uniref:Uncharacterized protein n=1 Tax=uncultured Caudovirales phage TaxID=2100421 RepID=A0A6J5L454_9CAUD|nr:hypothetical protein UFOVP105_15 [uncultured Caudovirales phage]
MENSKKNIAELLKGIVNDPSLEVYSIVCSVLSVDETERTIDAKPINGDAEIFGVRLQSSINSAVGVVSIPKVDSFVIVTFLNKLTGYVALCTEIDKILIDTPEITINGGKLGGLMNIEDVVKKLNSLEQKVNDLIVACSSVVVTLAPSGAFPLASFFTSVTPLTPTQKAEIEDPKIKH